jgi:hypothetical protein
LRADVADLRSKLTQLKADDAITKASINTTGHPNQKATTPGEPNIEIVKVATRLEREPALKAAVTDGLTAGHTGEKLGQYLADNGFLNGNGGKYTGASNSRFRLAIEHLNSINGA